MDPQKTPSEQPKDESATPGSDWQGNTPATTPPEPSGLPDTSGATGGAPESNPPAQSSGWTMGQVPTGPDPVSEAASEPASVQVLSPAAPTVFSPRSSMPAEAPAVPVASGVGLAPATSDTDTPADSGAAPAVIGMHKDPLKIGSEKHGLKKKGLLFGLITAGVALLLSGGAAASYYYYVANKPENVLKQALANMFDAEKVKSVHSSGTMVVGDDEMNIEVNYKTAMDTQTGAFDISGSADAFVTNLNFDGRTADGKTYYFRIGGLDGLAELIQSNGIPFDVAPLIELVNNKWIEVNQSLIKQAAPELKSSVLSQADRHRIAEAYAKYPFLAIKEKLADETIKGQASHHYKIVIDPAMLKTFIAALKESGLEIYKIEQKQLDAANKAIDRAKFDKYPIEVWISKKTKLFTQYRFAFTDEDGAKTDFKETVESYNQPVRVEKPEDSKSVLEIMGEFSAFVKEQYGDFFTEPTLPDGISL